MKMVGVSNIDITPSAGMVMSGFAARIEPAIDAHDALTVRAICVEDTALVAVDVIGIDAGLSKRARARCSLPAENVTIVATHTHGGPVSMQDRLFAKADPDYLVRLEDAIVEAIDTATGNRKPAQIYGGIGPEPGIAKNRRHTGGPVDKGVPVLRFDDASGRPFAFLVSYACHPVVLGADNRHWTADYPHFLRAELERLYPGAIAVFATGCAGDVNTGHSAAASLTVSKQSDRSFERASEIGLQLAEAVGRTELVTLRGGCAASEVTVNMHFEQREAEAAENLAQNWRSKSEAPGDLYHIWADWAASTMGKDIEPRPIRCSALNWDGAQIIALPGEIFAQTALEIRRSITAEPPLFLLAYGDENPGYIPPRNEYEFGGYEVEEAHRFYGLGATVAPGVAEALAQAGCQAAQTAAQAALEKYAN